MSFSGASAGNSPLQEHSPSKAVIDDWDDWMRWDEPFAIDPALTDFGPGALHNLDQISLTMDQELDFPEHLTTPSLSTDRQSSAGLPASPESLVQPNGRKRKTAARDDDDAFGTEGKPVKKTAHNVIEKKYRNNLNDKIIALRDSVPSLRVKANSKRSGSDGRTLDEDLDGLAPAQKLNKATVLSKATEYIRHLESRVRRAETETKELKARFELAELGTLSQQPSGSPTSITAASLSERASHARTSSTSTTFDSETQGMIPIPESMQRLRAGLLQRHVEPSPEGRRNSMSRALSSGREGVRRHAKGGAAAKLMVGSLAGLMLVEGFGANFDKANSSNPRRKRSQPTITGTKYLDRLEMTQTLESLRLVLAPALNHPTFLIVKIILLGVAILYVIVPLVYSPKSKSKKDPTTAVANLTKAPSLASPLEMRRSAWLTSIQIARVPSHRIYSKFLVLGRMTVELNLRNLLGWEWYNHFFRISEEEELARIKAWDIAVDALLAGGDSEIDKSRLTLAIMASGTLPETRTRFMMKALHIRVLLWRAINAGNGSWSIFENAVAGLGRWQWRKGQELQNFERKEEATKTVASHASTTDQLPDYLEALLSRNCDEVLVGPVIHRAYNLALNKPTTDEIEDSDDGLNSVVEDFAIRSPLDAIAAWFSCLVLRDSMVTFLEYGRKWDGFPQAIELSLSTSPPGSIAQLRALAVKAVFSRRARKQSLQQAFEILPQSTSNRPVSATPTSLLATPDVLVALRCALALDQRHESMESALEALESVETLLSHLPPSELHLLGFLASYTTLCSFNLQDSLQADRFDTLSSVATYLKTWIRGEPGRKCGLSKKMRGSILETCLRIKGNEADLEILEEDHSVDSDEIVTGDSDE
ncbi:MAG: hypothetical protein M1814_002232 [Vezdaea aestivalis]|nr:MAG: hypothetical protein M1814_002232 [Vezdaea aestivalis]